MSRSPPSQTPDSHPKDTSPPLPKRKRDEYDLDMDFMNQGLP